MTKTFKEVFPTLKLDKDMENLLENADVTRISVNHARDFYKIYVKAKRLIFKKNEINFSNGKSRRLIDVFIYNRRDFFT